MTLLDCSVGLRPPRNDGHQSSASRSAGFGVASRGLGLGALSLGSGVDDDAAPAVRALAHGRSKPSDRAGVISHELPVRRSESAPDRIRTDLSMIVAGQSGGAIREEMTST
ncbi:MAG TPA: hypothetical protein VK456_11555, partial [Xanthobacteraceae bacterium]|nr:hypothetical protein [Xanthobacteraceae bacterium]